MTAVTLPSGQRYFSLGEELVASGVENVAVRPKATTSYPESDALHLDEGPEVVYVYLRVEDLATDGELEARVERWSRTPARPFGGGRLRVSDEGENRLGTSGGRGSGVVRFAVRTWFGGSLPAGDYTVEVFAAGRGSRVLVAKKYFVVGY